MPQQIQSYPLICRIVEAAPLLVILSDTSDPHIVTMDSFKPE